MSIRSLATSAALGLAMLLGGCGGGSGLSGTDLAVSGVAPSAPLNGGDTAVFVMTVSNVGDYPATNLTIRNTVSQLSPAFLTITCTANGGGVCPAVTGSTMTVPSLTNGGSLVFQVSSTVVQGASGSISDSMSVSSDTADIYSTNNTATVTGTAASNDVSVTLTAPPGPLADGAATYTAVVTNTGPNDAPNVTLTTTLGTNFSLAPEGVTCVPTLGAVAPTLQTDGTLLTPLIPVNGVLTCSIPVTLTLIPNGTTTVEMQTSNVGDSHANNNQSTVSGCATLCNSLGITATPPTGPLLNSSAAFTMVIQNAGPAAATDVTITNTLSSNLTLAGAIICTPGGGAVAPVLQADGTLLASSIPFNGSLTCSVPVTVAAGTTGNVADTFSVSAAGNTHTPTSATASVSATLANNVGVTASSPVASVVGGGTVTFNAVVTNTGPSTAFDVALTNVLSANLSPNGAITCTATGGAVAPSATTGGGLTSPSIPVGGVLNCSIPVTVTSGANGTVFTTFTATAANDQRTSDNSATASATATSSSLGVSETTSATQVAAGSSVVFTSVVSNPGPGSASNVSVAWTNPVLSGVTFDAAPTCTATGGATCPTAPSYNMTGLSLGAGRTLVFKFSAATTSAFRGGITSKVAVASTEDQDLNNNASTATSNVVDPRNGPYTAFAADGNLYNLTVDFDAGNYTMSGNGQSTQHSFTQSGSNYIVSGSALGVEFRVAQDLIVGGHDFAGGVVPYVAARSFVTSLNAAAGTYDFATRNIPSGAAATTHAGTGLISGNTLSVCQGVGVDQNVYPLLSCDTSAKINYTVDPNSLFPFNASYIDTTTGSTVTYSFYVAISGGAKIFISAGTASDSSQQLRLGIIDSGIGISPGTVVGSSTTSDWVTILLTVNPTTSSPYPYGYSFTGSLGSDTVTNLGPIAGATAPKSLVGGNRTSDNASLYVLQASPLTIAVGGFGLPASGLLQVAVP